MYGNNDFRDYKADGMGGYHISHYGKKGMKWHKHLKAATDWWKYDVTGSGYKQDAQAAAAKADASHELAQKRFSDYQKSGRKADINAAANYGNRSEVYRKQEAYNNEQYEKKRDVVGRVKNAASTAARNAKTAIDSRVTGSTALKTAAKHDRLHKEYQKKSAEEGRISGRALKYFEGDHRQKSADSSRREASRYNKEAVNHLNKRNKAQAEYEKSLRGKAEKKLSKIFKKKRKKR